MKVPNCKLCGKAHWTYEDHSVSDSTAPQHVQEMAAGALSTTQSYEPPVIAKTIPVHVRAKIVDYVPPPPGDEADVLRKPVTKRNTVTPVTKRELHPLQGMPVYFPLFERTPLVDTSDVKAEASEGGPVRLRGRPKKHKSNAERQRAYRGRSK